MWVAGSVAVALILLMAFGPEARGVAMAQGAVESTKLPAGVVGGKA